MQNIFEIARSGLLAAQKATAVTSQNISNANPPGFTRQRAVLSTEVLRSGDQVLGRGVSIDFVQRLRDDLADKQIIKKESELGNLNEKSRIFEQLETSVVSNGDFGLDVAVSDFFDAFSDLSNNPQDINLRNILVSKSQSLVAKFRDMDQQIETVARQTLNKATDTVNKINSALNELASLNKDIAIAEGTNQPNQNSKDLQMEKLKELAELADADFITNSNGTIEVRIGNMVVLGGQEVSEIKTEADVANKILRLRLDNGKLLKTKEGTLGADIEMFENKIPDLMKNLDEIARGVVEEVNKIHSGGFGLNDAVQRTFFNPVGITAGTIELNNQISNEPAHIAASSVAGESGNNDVAIAISKLRNEKVLNGQSFVNNIVQMIADPGIELTELRNSIETKDSAKQLLIKQQENSAGVNIDEELTNMIKFQNSYQASARILNTAQEMYDTLLTIL